MTLFAFQISMHGHRRGDVVDVLPQDRESVQPLIDAGYLLPIYPESEEFPRPARRSKPKAKAGEGTAAK